MPATGLSNEHSSRFSIPDFRMPTMDDVVGNLGEPMSFVEYRVDDEDDERETVTTVDGTSSDPAQQGAESPLRSPLMDAEAAVPTDRDSVRVEALTVRNNLRSMHL